jgi:DNA-binding PadR family transcriptional regulator
MISDDDTLTYAGIHLLKKLDLTAEDGGIELPVLLPHAYQPLEPALERLALDGYVEIDRKRGRYQLTSGGTDHIGALIDEAEALIDELDELETEEVVEIVRRRNLDPMRVRFLWGWYQGEFDDLVLFQQRRGVATVERDWALYLQSEDFYAELARDL